MNGASVGRSPGVLIEFAGAPGAGKSTLAVELVARLRSLGHPVHDASLPAGSGPARAARLGRKASGLVGELVRAPVTTARIASATRTMPRGREVVARTVNLTLARAAARRARRRGAIVVLDQGFVQELASVARTGDPQPATEAVADARDGLLAGLVLLVTAPADLAATRLRQRQGTQSRLERDGEIDPAALDAAAAAVASIAKLLEARSGGALSIERVVNPGRSGVERATIDALVAMIESLRWEP